MNQTKLIQRTLGEGELRMFNGTKERHMARGHGTVGIGGGGGKQGDSNGSARALCFYRGSHARSKEKKGGRRAICLRCLVGGVFYEFYRDTEMHPTQGEAFCGRRKDAARAKKMMKRFVEAVGVRRNKGSAHSNGEKKTASKGEEKDTGGGEH